MLLKRACLVSLFVLLMLLVACQSEAPPEVTFMVSGDPAELVAYESLVAAFEAKNEDVTISLIHIPSDGEYRQRLATQFASGEPPNVMLMNYRRFMAFQSQDGLESLDRYIQDSTQLASTDFFPTALEAFQLNGQQWCLPQNISSLVVYYNKNLFDAAGVAYPTADWSGADFVAKAHALTQDTNGDGAIDQYGAGIEASLYRAAPFIWQSGGALVDDEAHPTRLTIDSPQTQTALQWFVDLQVKEQVVPDATAESAESSESRFLNGTLAMFFDSRRGTPTFRTIESFDWDVAQLPLVGGEWAGILHSDGYCMAAKTADKAAAWRFIEFANSAEGQRIVAVTGRTVPSRHDVASEPVFLDPTAKPANSRVWLDTVPFLGRVPLMANWPEIEKAASEEIEHAFYGNVSLAEAIQAALANTQPIFDEANK